MPKRTVQVELSELSGLPDETHAAIKGHLRNVCADLQARPGEGKARSITIKLAFTPSVNQRGMCDGAAMVATVKCSLPEDVASVPSVEIDSDAMQMRFRPGVPDDVRQHELADLEGGGH